VATGAIRLAKLQSNHHHQQTNTQFFLQAGCPSCRPTNSVKALKGKISHSMDLLTPSSPGSLPALSLTTNSSWGGLPCLSLLVSPLTPVPSELQFHCYHLHHLLLLITPNGLTFWRQLTRSPDALTVK